MKKDFKIQRSITFYEKSGETLIGERILLEEDFPLLELKRMFETSEKDPLLYEQYNINKEMANRIANMIDFSFDFDKYEYFFETFNVDLEIGNGVRSKDH
ncbi:DUF7683 domain-containing protein [Aquimarina algiphila]|uniref:DUF7683 domain-containing protein n=1 Tax=Aquimarina algiphila TaxID=2047982 RepID=A0A554VBB7_9FLAO|nr:hypothetical protein [Aquimarina algiphila]TSE03805.1 hypothetical protein FOF46_28455 [Aquimarina algiphila]